MKLVGSFRHPHDVAQSIVQRQPSIPYTHVFDLWTHYNQILLSYGEHRGVRVVCFDVSANEYLRAVQRLAGLIGLSGRETSEFFTPQLRHWQEQDWTGIPLDVRSLYDRLKAVSISPY